MGINRHGAGAAGLRVRGGPEVQSATRRAGTVAPRLRGALDRNYFNRDLWWPALQDTGVPQDRQNGMHALRHFYASVLLDEGESIKALAAYLGHADPGFTLRTYTHLMPTSEERTRRAIDRVFGDGEPASRPGDGLEHPGDEETPA